MPALGDKIMEELFRGHHCSQVMMLLSMKLRGIDDPFTIRALGGLANGMFSQRTCGTLTGAICTLSSYFARRSGEAEPSGYREPAQEFVEWFEKENGSLECRDLVANDRAKMLEFCPGLMERSFEKLVEILESHGIDPTGGA
ncbi:MAG: C-GCAxxG-C-C family protein [Treponema sp.]|jgi:C_GCAxxG_C_C family probable redox protein|nr:C-GCAxxG-C-C family protein [Treponema sp.]